MKFPFFLYLTFLLAGNCQNTTPQKINTSNLVSTKDSIKIAYIGNMGVLLESGDKTIILDGFHKKYKPAYLHPSENTVQQLVYGKYENFSPIEMALATHRHPDHFDVDYVAGFLLKNPNAVAVGTPQVKAAISEVQEEEYQKVLSQIHAVTYDDDGSSFSHQNISVKSFRCPHSNPAYHSGTQNAAHLINLNGFKILHLGDTDWGMSGENLQKHQIRKEEVDVAIIPYWLLYDKDAKEKMDALIAPKQIIATHISPGFSEQDAKTLGERFSNVTFFTKQGMEVKFSKK